MSWYNHARDPTHQLPGGEERSTRELSVGKMCLWRLGPYRSGVHRGVDPVKVKSFVARYATWLISVLV